MHAPYLLEDLVVIGQLDALLLARVRRLWDVHVASVDAERLVH